jgi:Protein of unknown function (DUF1059)
LSRRKTIMDELITATCECGAEFTGTEEDVIAQMQQHGRDVHSTELTPQEVLEMAMPTEA